MRTLWIEQKLIYDGSQLRSLYAYLNHQILGDSMIGWRGPCDVQPEKMVDGEDLLAGSRICGSDMVHFLVEIFDRELFSGVLWQRLMASVCICAFRWAISSLVLTVIAVQCGCLARSASSWSV